MAAGYLSNGQCVTSLQLAAQHFCGQFPRTVSTGAEPVTYSCAVMGNTGQVLVAAQVGTQTGGYSQFTPYYGTCDTTTFKPRTGPWDLSVPEASLIAAAILGVWGIAVCWRELATFIRGGTTGEDPR